MKSPFRNATVILGILLLGCAVMVLIKTTRSSPNGNEASNHEPAAKPVKATSANGTPANSGEEAATSPEGELTGRTKVRERPVETALDKKRKERNRIVAELEMYQKSGLAGRHPNVVKATANLQKVDAELAAAGDGAKPAD